MLGREREREVYRFHPEAEVVNDPAHNEPAEAAADAGLESGPGEPSEDGLDWCADADTAGDEHRWSGRSDWRRGGRRRRMMRPVLATAAGLLVGIGAVSAGERLLGATRAGGHTPTPMGAAWGSDAAGVSRLGQTTPSGVATAPPKVPAERPPARPAAISERRPGGRRQSPGSAPEPAAAAPIGAPSGGSPEVVAALAEAQAVQSVEAEFGFEG
jgi:hypothetical protein